MAKRVFLVVLDSFGVGEEPDAASFGDYGVNTLRSIAQSSSFNCPNLRALGLFNLDGIDFLPSFPKPLGAFGRLRERSMGKDTTIGHWELAGLESSSPLPTYPHGFPPEIIQKFEQRTGRSVLCNKPYSGTEVLKDFLARNTCVPAHSLYTSADSYFKSLRMDDRPSRPALRILPCRTLDTCWRTRRRPRLRGRLKDLPKRFCRPPRRHDYSLLPPGRTMLNYLSAAGKDVIAVGKINDIFAGSGITKSFPTSGNADGQQRLLNRYYDFGWSAFINLVDFDVIWPSKRYRWICRGRFLL